MRSRAACAESAVSTLMFCSRSAIAWGSACNRAGSSSTMRTHPFIFSIITSPHFPDHLSLWEAVPGMLRRAPGYFKRNRPLMIPDNPIGNRESQAGSRPHLLCRKERIEDPLLQFYRYAWPAIGNADLYGLLILCTLNGNDFLWRFAQRIARIGEQIDKDLLQLNGIPDDHHVFGEKMLPDLDLAQAKLLLHQ